MTESDVAADRLTMIEEVLLEKAELQERVAALEAENASLRQQLSRYREDEWR